MKNYIYRISEVFLPIIIAFLIPTMANAKGKETYISKTAIEACVEYGEEYNICPELLIAIAEKESGGNAESTNSECKGIMQVAEKWHKERMEKLGITDIYDTRSNIHVAADYLNELFERYSDVAVVLMIYNGDSNAKKFAEGKVGISKYAENILKRSEELERTHGK